MLTFLTTITFNVVLHKGNFLIMKVLVDWNQTNKRKKEKTQDLN